MDRSCGDRHPDLLHAALFHLPLLQPAGLEVAGRPERRPCGPDPVHGLCLARGAAHRDTGKEGIQTQTVIKPDLT